MERERQRVAGGWKRWANETNQKQFTDFAQKF